MLWGAWFMVVCLRGSRGAKPKQKLYETALLKMLEVIFEVLMTLCISLDKYQNNMVFIILDKQTHQIDGPINDLLIGLFVNVMTLFICIVIPLTALVISQHSEGLKQ